jgi:UPF0755 protein
LRHALFIFAIIAVLLAVGLAAAGLWLRSELKTPYYESSEPETFINIPQHATTSRVAEMLVDSGILKHKLPFILYLRFTKKGHSIQAGEYKFSGTSTPVRVAQRLVKGDIYFKSITIPEGLTAQETIELLARNSLGDIEEMEQLLLNTALIADLDPDSANLEGYLFPETYHFSRNADSETIIKTLVNQFRTRFTGMSAHYPLRPGWNAARIVTLASMIEKEVRKAEEGPLVASVYINRLDKRIPLACDATIIYAMKMAGIYEGKLSRADLVMKSPYNSYLHQDLPPGPIANPGENSLRAALNPATTDFYYYVSRNDGTHQFSKNFRQHQKAVDRFQKSFGRKQRGS